MQTNKLILFLLSIICFSCSGDDFPAVAGYEDVTSTIYESGKTYTRRFYCTNYLYAGIYPNGANNVYVLNESMCFLESECGRVRIKIDDSIYENDMPPKSLLTSVKEYNNSLDLGAEIQMQLIVDFEFSFDSDNSITFSRVSDWQGALCSWEPYLSPEDNTSFVYYLKVHSYI